jgi:hypothetical protein
MSQDLWSKEDDMKKILGLVALPLMVGCGAMHTSSAPAPALACRQPSASTLGAVEDLKRVLASNDGVLSQYRADLGIDGVEPKAVSPVTDARACGAVGAAVASYLRRQSPMDNLYVVQVGARYVALDANGRDASQFVLTKKFEVTDYLAP